MLDAYEIRKEIARLEYEESSYPNYAKLADLYTIQNQMQGGAQMQTAYSEAAPPRGEVGEYGASEFLRAVAWADAESAWLIMDELMSTLQLVNSRAYDSVMRKIRNI